MCIGHADAPLHKARHGKSAHENNESRRHETARKLLDPSPLPAEAASKRIVCTFPQCGAAAWWDFCASNFSACSGSHLAECGGGGLDHEPKVRTRFAPDEHTGS